jgi:hypothetical protein
MGKKTQQNFFIIDSSTKYIVNTMLFEKERERERERENSKTLP